MSLRGTNRGIGAERGKNSLIVLALAPCQSSKCFLAKATRINNVSEHIAEHCLFVRFYKRLL